VDPFRVLALADDLTGALEIGARFAGSVVHIETAPASGEHAAVIDTETRHLPPAEAAARIRSFLPDSPPELIYKKTDSTLRGNIGAELTALPQGRIHYVPAYPRLKRTVRGGILHVDGVPVHQTAFARDPIDPVTCSDIRSLLLAQGADLDRIVIHDGETDDDVRAAAARILQEPPPRLAAGPASLAGCLAELMTMAPSPPVWPRVPECSVINGSAHPASAAQVRLARQRGLFDSGWRPAACKDALAAPAALIIFGGDTARNAMRDFGDPPLHPVGEILPGAPLSWFEHDGRRWILITKAGGFGEPDLLLQLHSILGGAGPCPATPKPSRNR